MGRNKGVIMKKLRKLKKLFIIFVEKYGREERNRHTNGYYVHTKNCPYCKTDFTKDGVTGVFIKTNNNIHI